MGTPDSTSSKSRGKGSKGQRAGQFAELSSRIDVAGIKRLSEHNPQEAYMAVQQAIQETQQDLQQQQALEASSQDNPGMTQEIDVSSEKALQLQAQLPFQKQLQSLQELKTTIENELRARASSTPTLGR